MALYEWHAELTVASFGLIHHFEVLLRNAIDGALGAGQPQMPIKDTWRRYRLELDEAPEPLNCVEMDTHPPPKEQAARLAHYDARADSRRQWSGPRVMPPGGGRAARQIVDR